MILNFLIPDPEKVSVRKVIFRIYLGKDVFIFFFFEYLIQPVSSYTFELLENRDHFTDKQVCIPGDISEVKKVNAPKSFLLLLLIAFHCFCLKFDLY